MKRRHIVIACVFTAFAVSSAAPIAAVAEPSCTDWMDQGDGTSWKECVNDDGSQHCYKISNATGSTAYEVSCSE
ncbi:MAG: hypothetical protein KGL29_07590 [Alphaproteobacteria bacterium]|nr:hypothetical protein [Alphaproteobacteria bacterium]MDE2164369.1 hypothetical protein [Alphaproteobacteria bacterium]MDE2265746.1 hypothetical protein [Alphaproteobacteria bacterium]